MADQKTGQMVPAKQQYNDLQTMLMRNKGQIALALPKHVNPDRMLRIALTSVRMNPKLLTCDQPSFLSALMACAALGLEPDGVQGQAWLLPYWNSRRKCNEVQLRVGYRGLMDLARRTREIANWFVGGVREKDFFEFEYGSKAFLKHKPTSGDRGRLVAAYAGAAIKDGGVVFRVLFESDIERAKKASSSRDRDGNLVGPWVTDEEEMWMKTAIRRVCKLLPTSPEMQHAVAIEDQAETGREQDLGVFTDISGSGIDSPGWRASAAVVDPTTGEIFEETEQDSQPGQQEPESAGGSNPKGEPDRQVDQLPTQSPIQTQAGTKTPAGAANPSALF